MSILRRASEAAAVPRWPLAQMSQVRARRLLRHGAEASRVCVPQARAGDDSQSVPGLQGEAHAGVSTAAQLPPVVPRMWDVLERPRQPPQVRGAGHRVQPLQGLRRGTAAGATKAEVQLTLPIFTPAPVPFIEEKFGTHVDYKASPTCAACGTVCWSRDAATGTCRACWRVSVYAVAAWREAAAVGPTAFDALAEQRTAREVPRLTDTSGPTGVALDVGLAPPPKPGAPRKRP